ncbi:MAG: PAC2 family protein [Candidatus Woesearchaeota archaeon]
MWNLQIKRKDFVKPVFLEGLPGIGNVGKVVVDYIIEEFNAEKIGSIFSYNLPNTVFVNENNLVELPKIEIYYKKINDQDFLFLSGDVQPNNEKACYDFCERAISLLEKAGCAEIITLGGIGLGEIPKKPSVFCTGNDLNFIKEFVSIGARDDIYGLVGPIIGVSGLLVGLSAGRIKAATLLCETYSHPMYLGLKEAKSILQIIDSRYNLNISFDKLNTEISKNYDDEDVPKLKKDVNYIG